MANVIVNQMPAFKQKYKKLTSKEKESVDDAIQTIITDPRTGEEKKGDLSGVFIYKFRIANQQILLAHEWNKKSRLLLGLFT